MTTNSLADFIVLPYSDTKLYMVRTHDLLKESECSILRKLFHNLVLCQDSSHIAACSVKDFLKLSVRTNNHSGQRFT